MKGQDCAGRILQGVAMIETRLTQAFDLELPILSAPMALAAGGALASAVTKAGGLGLIGGGYGDRDWLDREFRAAGNTRVGCGFITWKLAEQPDLLRQALDHDPVLIFLSFGDPAPFAAQIAQADVPLVCQVQTLDHAKEALDAGAMTIVAQGGEAGGHGASRATVTLVPELVDYLARKAPDVLLLAAGGIADGRGLAASLMLGADGVLIGTRLWATKEALVARSLQEAAIAAGGDGTIRSSLPDIARQINWPAPFTIRTLQNEFTRRWQGDPEGLRAIGGEAEAYARAAAEGDANTVAAIAGEAVGLIDDIPAASDVITKVAQEAKALRDGGWSRIGTGTGKGTEQ
jgi:nitronate monooxygenase